MACAPPLPSPPRHSHIGRPSHPPLRPLCVSRRRPRRGHAPAQHPRCGAQCIGPPIRRLRSKRRFRARAPGSGAPALGLWVVGGVPGQPLQCDDDVAPGLGLPAAAVLRGHARRLRSSYDRAMRPETPFRSWGSALPSAQGMCLGRRAPLLWGRRGGRNRAGKGGPRAEKMTGGWGGCAPREHQRRSGPLTECRMGHVA